MKRLTCGCCGEAALGKQHWNHDTGYGLCAKCVPFVSRFGTDELFGYGTPGVNYAVPLSRECKPGMLVSWTTIDREELHVGTLKEWDNGTAIITEDVKWMTGEPDKNVAIPS